MACLTNGVFRRGSRSTGMTGEAVDPRKIPGLLAPASVTAARLPLFDAVAALLMVVSR